MQAAQDITIGARLSKTQYQYTLVDVDSDELDHWAPILVRAALIAVYIILGMQIGRAACRDRVLRLV
jgi:hypothetical protein